MSIFTFVPYKLNEGPKNIDIVLYLYMRIICDINMCYVEEKVYMPYRRFLLLSRTSTQSPTHTHGFVEFHLWRDWFSCMTNLSQHIQNWSTRCCTLRHRITPYAGESTEARFSGVAGLDSSRSVKKESVDIGDVSFEFVETPYKEALLTTLVVSNRKVCISSRDIHRLFSN